MSGEEAGEGGQEATGSRWRAANIENARNLAELGRFCRRMGREAHQGEIGLVVGDEYFAIHDFAEE